MKEVIFRLIIANVPTCETFPDHNLRLMDGPYATYPKNSGLRIAIDFLQTLSVPFDHNHYLIRECYFFLLIVNSPKKLTPATSNSFLLIHKLNANVLLYSLSGVPLFM